MLGSLPPTARLARRLGFLPLLAAIAFLAGCGGGKGKQDIVSGKVTMNGQAVSGIVVFVCSDGKEISSPTAPDGGYQIVAPAKGEAKIAVKGMGAMPAGGAAGGPAPGMPGMPGGGAGGGKAPPEGAPGGPNAPKADMPGMGGSGAGGVAPPAKYASPTTSGLTVTVTGGEQKHDIDLK